MSEEELEGTEEVGPVVWAGLADAVAAASTPSDADIDLDVDLGRVGRAAEHVAVSAMLATSLSAALSEPPRNDLVTLPEPTPIVRVLESFEDDVPDTDDDTEPDLNAERRKRLLRLLRMLALAVLLALVVAFGALRGCASCAAQLALPPAEEQEESGEGDTSEEGPASEAQATELG